jgi:hypothetical protein
MPQEACRPRSSAAPGRPGAWGPGPAARAHRPEQAVYIRQIRLRSKRSPVDRLKPVLPRQRPCRTGLGQALGDGTCHDRDDSRRRREARECGRTGRGDGVVPKHRRRRGARRQRRARRAVSRPLRDVRTRPPASAVRAGLTAVPARRLCFDAAAGRGEADQARTRHCPRAERRFDVRPGGPAATPRVARNAAATPTPGVVVLARGLPSGVFPRRGAAVCRVHMDTQGTATAFQAAGFSARGIQPRRRRFSGAATRAGRRSGGGLP